MKRYIGIILLVLLLASCSTTANETSNTASSKNDDEPTNEVELVVDKDNIKDLNNATDDEISSPYWIAYESGTGIDRSFNNGGYYALVFNFGTGYKYMVINGQTTAMTFRNYFVIRKGSDNNFYLIYYKEEDENASSSKKIVYKYCYECYKYLVSDNYLKLEESNVIIDDVYDYVQSKL